MKLIRDFIEGWRLAVSMRKRGGRTAELKPCPFCGKSVAECAGLTDIEMIDGELYEMWNDHVVVVCNPNKGGCGSMTSGQHYSREAAIEAWNRRAANE